MEQTVFERYGGLDQLRIDDHSELSRIELLDLARWAATSAPVRDLQCDPALMGYLDTDGTGRIRPRQLLAARDWLFHHLANREPLAQKTEVLQLADIDTSHEEGRLLRAAAERVLSELDAPERERLTLAQLRSFRTSYLQMLANGDGVVPPEVLGEAPVAELAQGIIAITGGTPDLSGRTGVSASDLERFCQGAPVYLAWKAKGNPANGDGSPVLPWGEDTAAAAELVRELDPKIELYFRQCDLVQHEELASSRMRLPPGELEKLPIADPAAIEGALLQAPLAPPAPDGRLDLAAPINPMYREKFEKLKSQVLRRALNGKNGGFLRKDWRSVKEIFAPYWIWQDEKPKEPFDGLGEQKIVSFLEPERIERLKHFIAVDLSAKKELDQLANLEKLILYQRWMLELANNFVNFSLLYDPKRRALFEAGTLVIDGRRLEFCMRVADRAAHKAVAAESKMFLIYAKILDREGGATLFEVAAPVTSGERGRLTVGKRGIFLGVDGKEQDAVIVEVVENPISLIEAIKAPFTRTWAFVQGKVEGFATAKLKAAEQSAAAKLDSTATALQTAPTVPPPAGGPAAAPEPKKDAAAGGGVSNLLLGGGIAFAALGSAMAYIVSTLAKVSALGLLKAVASIVLVIVGFSALLGWLKLRKRDLAPLLEASGWATNLRMKLNARLGRLFTRRPGLPRGSVRSRASLGPGDPRRSSGMLVVAIVLLVTALVLLVWRLGGELGHPGSGSPAPASPAAAASADVPPLPAEAPKQP